MSISLTSYPRTSGGGGSDLARFDALLEDILAGTAFDMEQAAGLLAILHRLSDKLDDLAMVALAVKTRHALALARARRQVAGSHYRDAMRVCATHWMRLYPAVAATGLAARERAVVTSMRAAATPVARRAAVEEAGTVAWLYHLSALLGEDVTATVTHAAAPIAGTRYTAFSENGVLRYLECGASYNVNQFLRVDHPDASLPPIVIAGEAKGGASGYGVVKGPRAFMLQNGQPNATINQRDILYPLSRAAYMARANAGTPAGPERRQAGKAMIDARRDGLFLYLAVRGDIDLTTGTVNGKCEEFKC